MPMRYVARAGWIGVWCLTALAGCAHAPYQYGRFACSRSADGPPPCVKIEYGRPCKSLDRIAWIVGMPARILPLNARINKHQISPETADKLRTYLEKNDLTDVHVYVNQYDPSGQWQRLRENKRVSPLWRYSVGALSIAGYTLFPGRIYGGDSYNPYTNSLYLNSDVPAVVLHEAAFAKDVHSRKLPGTYAFVNELPFFSLWHESLAMGDILGYAREQQDWDVEHQTYCVQCPRMGVQSVSIAGPLTGVWWGGAALGLGGAAAGHVAGHTLAARRDAELRVAKPLTETPAEPAVQQATYLGGTPPLSASDEPLIKRLPTP
jgi:hypothetical protein